MLIIVSVIFPAAVASAASSNGFILAKNFSTLAAVFVLAPRSIKFAPSETTPSGILKTPDATPDKIERMVPTSLSSVSCFLSISASAIPLVG